MASPVARAVPAPVFAHASGVATEARCPWVNPSFDAASTPSALAQMVLSKMSLNDKLDIVDLAAARGYENSTVAIPSLCIPALTLQDGPNGISKGDHGVTQLPASLGLAATFDPSLTYAYGSVIGDEARRQGIDVVQGPNLNLDRVPQSGRAFEGFGEDPVLASVMGVADIEGIQSQGVMADAKHFTAYNQETDRTKLDEQVSARALEELYLPPFKAAVQQGNVASLMCSYGELNGVNDCQSSGLFHVLYGEWGFKGFVRSDLGSVTSPPAALAAGTDQIKPAAASSLRKALADHSLSMDTLNRSVVRVLREMFTYNLIADPIHGRPNVDVATRTHAAVALDTAEQSIVLLKNARHALPLSTGHLSSIAVIGSDASSSPMSAGGGSAHVVAPFLSTPLQAIESAVGKSTRVTFAAGGSSLGTEPALSGWSVHTLRPIVPELQAPLSLRQSEAVSTGSFSPASFPGVQRWSAVVTPPYSGEYVFSLSDSGDTWLSLDHHVAIASPGVHGSGVWSVGEHLVAGRQYPVSLSWYPVAHAAPPSVGWRFVGTPFQQAVAAAKRSSVAVVFASDISSEGLDRPSLSLPGDANALISAIAAVNHHTIVVLNTGGPVLMPWLSKVAAVLEAWYPGEQDGRATAAVLFGRVDPGGHLPVTFPASVSATPAQNAAAYPGVDGVVTYAEGLDVGYRYEDANHLDPLFPFGYGLSYTTFSLSNLAVVRTAGGYDATLTVTNTGSRVGSEVVQGYLGFPAVAGEPPLQLKAFQAVTLRPGQSAPVSLELPAAAFTYYATSGWRSAPGTYGLAVGTSSRDIALSASLVAPDQPGAPVVPDPDPA